tara:strand:+ start:2467 stop:3999 length:1533 start_codon:yes stop_codon:yes gene_type:complete
MIILSLLAHAHVPTYSGGCSQNCCEPPHSHKTSQVIYLKGSGGLEIHVKSYSEPFDINGSEVIHFDAVFRDAVDPSTYALYVGCGGCMTHDPIVASPEPITGYQTAQLEPFTQTAYRSAFHKDNRKFSAALLSPALCPQQHFTIRLVDFGNRSDGQPIVWAPVVGPEGLEGESFTLVELLSFPLFILANHGYAWTGLGWTWWLSLFLAAPTVLLMWRELQRRWYKEVPLSSQAVWIAAGQEPGLRMRDVDPREALYDLAILFFVASFLEMFFHLVVAQTRAAVTDSFLVALFAVILLPQLAGVAFVWYVWKKMHESRGRGKSPWRPEQQGHVRALLATFLLLAALVALSVLSAVYQTVFLVCTLQLVVLAVIAIPLAWPEMREAVAEFVDEVVVKDHGSPFWAPLEVGAGFSLMFLLGAGLFGGPACIMLAGLVRMQEIWVDGVGLGERRYALAAEENAPVAPAARGKAATPMEKPVKREDDTTRNPTGNPDPGRQFSDAFTPPLLNLRA